MRAFLGVVLILYSIGFIIYLITTVERPSEMKKPPVEISKKATDPTQITFDKK